MNQNFLNRQEEKRIIPTSLVYKEGEKPKPSKDGTFYKFLNPTNVTDAFKRTPNPDIVKIKNTCTRAKNLGPGIPDLSRDTFNLLKVNRDPLLVTMQ